MPTKKKRIGFIPRGDVLKIIDKLSLENNLSNSKIISILVEEALSIRGILNKQTGKVIESKQNNKNHKELSSQESCDFIENKKLNINNKLKNNYVSCKTTILKQTNLSSFDKETYEKFLSFLKFQEMMNEYDT